MSGITLDVTRCDVGCIEDGDISLFLRNSFAFVMFAPGLSICRESLFCRGIGGFLVVFWGVALSQQCNALETCSL